MNLTELENKFSEAIRAVQTSQQLEETQKQYLGRKGYLNAFLEDIQKVPLSERKTVGEQVNTLKKKIQGKIADRKIELEQKSLEENLKAEKIDCTLPSSRFIIGKPHPLTQVMDEVIEIFAKMGFIVAEGPEIEFDENNFTSLNIPEDHPARDMHDTFYIADRGLGIANLNSKSEMDSSGSPQVQNTKLLLRTHTSPVQIRVMKNQSPPVRIIAPGKVFRHEAIDATHSSVFHQVEGLAVDQSISFADLKGTIELFNRHFFGETVKTRFRPSYFPFVEPGAEVDISCTVCKPDSRPNSCPVCKGSGWLEMMGAGMVHPNVFKAVGYDPEKVTGFAFGMGIERIAMVRYGIIDMRLFYENHIDFLNQF